MNDYQKVVMKGIEPPAPKDRIKETSIKRFNKYHDNAVDEMLSFDTKSSKPNTIATSAHVRAAMENARQYEVGERPLDDRFHMVKKYQADMVSRRVAANKAAVHSGERANLNYENYTDEEIAR